MSTGQSVIQKVSKQVCAECLLAHANKTLNNSDLTQHMSKFLINNRSSIVEFVKPEDVVFVASRNRMVIVKKNPQDLQQELTPEQYNNIKLQVSQLNDIEVTNTRHINTNFHNHNESKISINLDDNKVLLLVSL